MLHILRKEFAAARRDLEKAQRVRRATQGRNADTAATTERSGADGTFVLAGTMLIVMASLEGGRNSYLFDGYVITLTLTLTIFAAFAALALILVLISFWFPGM